MVTFRKRFDQSGEPADNPASLLDVSDGVIEDAEMMEIIEPAAVDVAEDINSDPSARTGALPQSSNDDGFLGFGTETWIYDVADDRDAEFRQALVNSEVVLDFHEFDDEMIRKPFAQP
jgi:hypothetical protein